MWPTELHQRRDDPLLGDGLPLGELHAREIEAMVAKKKAEKAGSTNM